MSIEDRQIRIATGSGIEKILSDNFLKKVIEEEMTPYFKHENFYNGIMAGLNKIIEEWNKSSQ